AALDVGVACSGHIANRGPIWVEKRPLHRSKRQLGRENEFAEISLCCRLHLNNSCKILFFDAGVVVRRISIGRLLFDEKKVGSFLDRSEVEISILAGDFAHLSTFPAYRFEDHSDAAMPSVNIDRSSFQPIDETDGYVYLGAPSVENVRFSIVLVLNAKWI